MAATREDATLLIQMMQWGAQIGLEDSLRAIFSPDFDPEAAPMDDPSPAKVLTFGEALGTFVKQGLLDADLVRDFLWLEGMWGKVSHHALAAREESGEPRLYENFEALATASA